MADEKEQKQKGSASSSSSGGTSQSSTKESGDPGRTPGQAEGDEATVDESLRQKEAGGRR